MWFCPIFFLFNSNGELKTKQKDDEYSGIKHQRSGIQCETIAFRSAPKQNRCPAAHLICRRFACTCGRRGSWPRKPSCPSREARRSSWAAVRWTAGTRRWRCRSCARPRCLRRARPWTSPSPGKATAAFSSGQSARCWCIERQRSLLNVTCERRHKIPLLGQRDYRVNVTMTSQYFPPP